MSISERRLLTSAELDEADARCPASKLLRRLSERWVPLVLISLADGNPHRFSHLQREIGNISPKMLSQTLRGLERDGLVERTVGPGRPPEVRYRVTTLGRSLLDPLGALSAWAYANAEEMEGSRATFDTRIASATAN